MENLKKISSLFLIAVFMTACASTNNKAITQQPDSIENTADDQQLASTDKDLIRVNNPRSLALLLARAPGVFLDFRSGIPKIRGGFPLYVVNGVRLGKNYSSVAQSVNIDDVRSVQVLKSPSETLIYGRSGTNGVIIIKTI